MTISEPTIRRRLDNWRFWVGVAYFGIAIALVGLYGVFEQQSTETAKRVAIQRAAAQAQVTACAVAVKNTPVVDGFVRGQRAIILNQVLATTGALASTSTADPLYRVREASLRRLEEALTNVNQLAGLVKATTPGRAQCNTLAERLGTPHPFPPTPGGK